jgi:hypothetical protein
LSPRWPLKQIALYCMLLYSSSVNLNIWRC